MNSLVRLLFILSLAGCASYQAPPLPADHPANPAARESVAPPAHSNLGEDSVTRATKREFATTREPGNEAAAETHEDAVKKTTEGDVYTCPMHPQIKSSKPGNCPICGMKLVKQNPEATHENH